MKARFLLPHAFKRLAWVVFIPALVFGIIVQHFEFEIPGLYLGQLAIISDESLFPLNNLTNELAALLVLVSGFVVAFSKEKIEDEWVSRVRLESLQLSVYLNYLLLFISIIIVYDTKFFTVLVYNMFTILIFFIIRFNYVMYLQGRIFRSRGAMI